MFKAGQKVRIKENAFPDPRDEYDVLARGKTGVIMYDLEQVLSPVWKDCYEVELDEPIGSGDNVPRSFFVTEEELGAHV